MGRRLTDEEINMMPPEKRRVLLWQRKNADRLAKYQREHKDRHPEKYYSWPSNPKSCRLPLTDAEKMECKNKKRERNKQEYQENKKDPEFVETHRKRYRDRYHSDPEFRAKRSEYLKEWKKKKKEEERK